ncbi:MAG: sugar phosphate nucleotidyltransferase [Phycisphaerae bacterium]
MECVGQFMKYGSRNTPSHTRKAVVLAAGLGTRMRKIDAKVALGVSQEAAANAGLKAMIPFARPFLDYVLTPLADAGIREVCLVIGPAHHEIRDYYGRPGISTRLHFTFAVQNSPRGTADALLAAEEFAGADSFVVLNSDNYYPPAALDSLCALESPGLVGYQRTAMVQGSGITADRICNFAVIRSNQLGDLEAILEKPSPDMLSSLLEPVLLSMNSWRFNQHIFAACRHTRPSARGELELPDAVMISMREFGVRYRVIACAQAVLDLSTRADIATVAARMGELEVRL